MKKLAIIAITLFISNTLLSQWSDYDYLMYPRSSTRAVSKDNLVFVIGGMVNANGSYVRSQTMDIIDEANDTIYNVLLPGPATKFWPAIVAGDKGVYMFGGLLGNNSITNRSFRFASNNWQELDTMPMAMWLGSSVKVGNKLIVGGGLIEGTNQPTDKICVYDESTEKWSIETMSSARKFFGMVSDGSKVYFAGGFDDELSMHVSKVVDVWDVANNIWTTDSLSVGRAGSVGAFINGKVLFAGGWYPGVRNSSDVVDIFDGTNRDTVSLSEPRGWSGAAVINDQVVFVGGGHWDSNVHDIDNASSAFDVYDASSNSWSHGHTKYLRYLSGVAATDNHVYAAGGINYINSTFLGYFNSVEVYTDYTGFQPLNFADNFKVYPNPTNGRVHIDGLFDEVDFRLFDQLGRQLKEGTLSPSNNQLDLFEFQKGHYYLNFGSRTEVLIIE